MTAGGRTLHARHVRTRMEVPLTSGGRSWGAACRLDSRGASLEDPLCRPPLLPAVCDIHAAAWALGRAVASTRGVRPAVCKAPSAEEGQPCQHVRRQQTRPALRYLPDCPAGGLAPSLGRSQPCFPAACRASCRAPGALGAPSPSFCSDINMRPSERDRQSPVGWRGDDDAPRHVPSARRTAHASGSLRGVSRRSGDRCEHAAARRTSAPVDLEDHPIVHGVMRAEPLLFHDVAEELLQILQIRRREHASKRSQAHVHVHVSPCVNCVQCARAHAHAPVRARTQAQAPASAGAERTREPMR